MGRWVIVFLFRMIRADVVQRSLLGDPAFVEGMGEYQEDILKKVTVDDVRSRISDARTQNVSAYDPDGFESLNTYAPLYSSARLSYSFSQAWNLSHRHGRPFRLRNHRHHHDQPTLRK
jgi:hypothetical protein